MRRGILLEATALQPRGGAVACAVRGDGGVVHRRSPPAGVFLRQGVRRHAHPARAPLLARSRWNSRVGRRNSDTRTPLAFTAFNAIPGCGFNCGQGPGSFYEFYFSFDFLTLVFGVLPITWAARRGIHFLTHYRARRRAARGHLCTTCGYDLRATPDRCPECGTVAQPPHHPPIQRAATASSGAVE